MKVMKVMMIMMDMGKAQRSGYGVAKVGRSHEIVQSHSQAHSRWRGLFRVKVGCTGTRSTAAEKLMKSKPQTAWNPKFIEINSTAVVSSLR